MNLRIRTRGIGAAATVETQHHAPTGGSRRGETASFGPNHLVVDTCLRRMPFIYYIFTKTKTSPLFSSAINHEFWTVAVALVSLSALQVTDSSGVMPSGCPPPRRRPPTISEHKDPIRIKKSSFWLNPFWNSEIKVWRRDYAKSIVSTDPTGKSNKILSAPHFLCFSPRSVIGCALIPDLFHLCSPYLNPAQTFPCLLSRSRGQAVKVNGFFFFMFYILSLQGNDCIGFVAFSQYAFYMFWIWLVK